MNMRLAAAFLADVRFQFRHGFYYAYLFVSVVYIALLRLVEDGMRQKLAVLVVFSDPAMLGFFFIGGIILLEKAQGIFSTLFVTPIRIAEYVWAKVWSLTLLSLSTSFLILLATVGTDMHVLPILIGVTFTSVLATLMGIGLAVRVKTVNQFLVSSVLFVPIFFTPVMEWIGGKSFMYYLFPGKAGLLFLEGGFAPITWNDTIYSLCMLLCACVAAYYFALRSLMKWILFFQGGEQQ
jgi:fluoroquinolone transport system permease protein